MYITPSCGNRMELLLYTVKYKNFIKLMLRVLETTGLYTKTVYIVGIQGQIFKKSETKLTKIEEIVKGN